VPDESLELALMRFVLDEQPSEELPSVATNALVAGVDSPSLRVLAGLRASDYADARDLFTAAVDELGLARPTPDEARWYFVRRWARAMVDGAISPYEASRMIWWRGWEELGHPDSLTVFVGLASEWEDDEARRPLFEADMLTAARALLDTHA
jgi:hypothetical protein